MKLTEAEIDEKFRELAQLIIAQSPDRIKTLEDELKKEATYEETRFMPTASKRYKGSQNKNCDND